LPGYLAGASSITGHVSRHAAARITGREILVALIVVVIYILLLVIPVLYGAGFDSFSRGMSKAARPAFLFGLGVLVVGLVSGVRILDIAGGAIMAAVVVGVIVENYLMTGRCRARETAPAGLLTRWTAVPARALHSKSAEDSVRIQGRGAG
jgi:hypothetical protein